jgi:hypothetical protein
MFPTVFEVVQKLTNSKSRKELQFHALVFQRLLRGTLKVRLHIHEDNLIPNNRTVPSQQASYKVISEIRITWVCFREELCKDKKPLESKIRHSLLGKKIIKITVQTGKLEGKRDGVLGLLLQLWVLGGTG